MYTTDELVNAIKANDVTRIEAILDAEPVLVNARTEQGVSMVAMSVYYGHPEIARLLVERNAQIDFYDAVILGELERAAGWLAMQPSLANSFSADGYSPLGLAAFFGHSDLVNLLLAHHADPNVPSNNAMQVMPLHSAAAGNHNAIAMRLVEAGANVNAVQAGGFTPLMAAAQNGNLELAQFLIGKGADVNARTDKGAAEFSNITALGLAQQANAPEVAALLEAAGATL